MSKTYLDLIFLVMHCAGVAMYDAANMMHGVAAKTAKWGVVGRPGSVSTPPVMEKNKLLLNKYLAIFMHFESICIARSAAKILHGMAVISYDMASILWDVPDILHVQHQFFGLFKGKNTLFSQKCKKIGLVAKEEGGLRSKRDNYHFF